MLSVNYECLRIIPMIKLLTAIYRHGRYIKFDYLDFIPILFYCQSHTSLIQILRERFLYTLYIFTYILWRDYILHTCILTFILLHTYVHAYNSPLFLQMQAKMANQSFSLNPNPQKNNLYNNVSVHDVRKNDSMIFVCVCVCVWLKG